MSANLVHRELRKATFEGKKMPTLITFLDLTTEFDLRQNLSVSISLTGGAWELGSCIVSLLVRAIAAV